MKMLIAASLGFLAGWLYGSERARSEARRRLAAAPQSVASAASTGAQRVSGLLDAAPLPPQVKDTASRVTSKVRTTAEGQPQSGEAPEYIGTPGVESAAGRDRTRDGDLPPDLARP